MSLAIEIKMPPVATRERVWKNVLFKNHVHLTNDELKHMVELNISPAVIDSAARFTANIDGSAEVFRFAARGIMQAMNSGRQILEFIKEDTFQIGLTKADMDLHLLTDSLCKSPTRAFSICIYGPSGTGKSAYLLYLAEQLKMPVILKRASDLFNKYVGESEKGIARAFQEAIDHDALLIFDEADSLLGDRRHATKNWEVSQVNEMLTWMERHPLPFACTTNLRERLDPASLRRFTFKCQFDYLDPDLVTKAYRYFFGHELNTSSRQELFTLTPGDFAVVKRKAEILGLLDNPAQLAELLMVEACNKDCAGLRRKFGFN